MYLPYAHALVVLVYDVKLTTISGLKEGLGKGEGVANEASPTPCKYRKSGNFRCKNIFVVNGGYEN